jgi:hypothetical protein
MRFELRLIAVAALLLIVIAASCQRQCIAATGSGAVPGEREPLPTGALDTPAPATGFLAGA